MSSFGFHFNFIPQFWGDPDVRRKAFSSAQTYIYIPVGRFAQITVLLARDFAERKIVEKITMK